MNIATKLTAQVKGLNQAARNVNDTSSMLKTAESALSENNNLLQRLRELAVQAGNDTNTAADRQALQAEADQLVSEIDRVANQVQYNGQALLDGTFTSKTFQIGANSGQTLAVSVDGARARDVGNSHQLESTNTTQVGQESEAGATGYEHQAGVGYVDDAAFAGTEIKIGGANGNTEEVGATTEADDTVSTAQADTSAIAKAAAINRVSAQTGVTAEATASTWQTRAGANGVATGTYADGDIEINGVSITVASGTATLQADDADGQLQDAINAKTAQTGVTASLDSNNNILLTADDGRNIAVKATAQGLARLADGNTAADTVTVARGGLKFSSNDTSGNFNITVQAGTNDLSSIGAGGDLTGADGETTLSSDVTSGNEISALKLGSTADAASAVTNLDTAIAQVASSRSDIGALLNRLDSASNTLKISAENSSAARSSVQDVDFASETAKFSKNQILQQASSSMLAQANVSGQLALSLLGFG